MRGAFLLVVVVLASAGCGGDDDSTSTTPVETVPAAAKPAKQVVVHESEFKLDPAKADGGDLGLVSIKIVNDGNVAHSLAVDGPNGEVQLDGRVEPGKTATLEVDVDKPGTYAMYCPLDGHRAKGMSGSISVGGDNPARGAEQTGTSPTTTSTTPTQTQTSTQTQTQTQTETKTVTTPSETETETTPTATTGSPSAGYGY